MNIEEDAYVNVTRLEWRLHKYFHFRWKCVIETDRI